LGVSQRLLGVHQLFLHLLRGREQLLHIHLGFHIALLCRAYAQPGVLKPVRRTQSSVWPQPSISPITRPPSSRWMRSMPVSSASGTAGSSEDGSSSGPSSGGMSSGSSYGAAASGGT